MVEEKMIVPKDIVDEVKEYSENHKIPFDRLKEQLREFYFGACKTFPAEDGTRARNAMLTLKAVINAGTTGAGINLDGIAFHMTQPESIIVKKGTPDEKTMDRAFLVGAFKHEGKKKFMKIGIWDDAIVNAKKIPHERVVRLTNIMFKDSEKYGPTFTLNSSSTFQVLDNDVKDTSRIIEALFKSKKVELEEVEMKPSDGWTDYKLVKARVKDSNITPTRSGKIMSVYTVYDDDATDEDLMTNSEQLGFTIRCDSSLGKFAAGSLCYFLGTITETTEQYSASMFAEAVVPIICIKKTDDLFESEISNATARKEYYAQQKEEEVSGNAAAKTSGPDLSNIEEDINLESWGE